MSETNSQFHYVTTAEGALSGKSLVKQTEDAINDLAGALGQSNADAAEALRRAKNAEDTANAAQTNATEALVKATTAANSVITLQNAVNGWSVKIDDANKNAAAAQTTAGNAVATAADASKKADNAVATARAAKTTADAAKAAADQAVTVAGEARTTAQSAETKAEQAVKDTTAAEARIAEKVTEATAQAASAATSATAAANSANLAQKWATWTSNSAEDGQTPDYTVDGTEYSAKWYAQKAAENATQKNTVLYVEQTLTTEQKKQAQTNVDAASASEIISLCNEIAAE